MELPSSYEPHETERKWNEIWQKENLFHADPSDHRPPFTIVIPPPNVTGSLHMGHALNNTLQDILVRWQRMSGKAALWMPGMDHAGIATQNVVERLLAQEGVSRHDLGREAFEAKVWDWKEHSGGQIKSQLKRLGASCDWDRERFTLDEGLSHAVRKVFVTLYKEGLIYQGHRIINWCPRCGTALSDIETEYKDLAGRLYHLRYPLQDGSGHIVVATTRPETMLGDTAVAVNPNDPRTSHLIGKKVILPLMNREIPIIGDDFVDMEFGTGFVKVTPAHDPNDFEMGRRHNLEEINIMDEKGIINELGGSYAGLERFEARKKVMADLDAMGLVEKVEEHNHAVGHCYRCHTIIEPFYSKQWFVQIKPLAEPAIKAVEEERIRFVPANWAKTYYEWMYNIRDWCISRQLWWGHRIPAFYCQDCGDVIVELEDPTSCPNCRSTNLVQDEDVLDTWFSSALWPFSTLGWPEETPELEKFYPTSVLVTGFDIIFFWVARMIMMGLKFMGDVPFRDVYIHALVRDEHGQKMSKSKGNVIDPLIMMDQYGTDAFRFTLAIFAAQGRDIIMSEKRIEGYRAFCNKIWNATRFIMMNMGDDFKPAPLEKDRLEFFDRWILDSLNKAITDITTALAEYRFNEAAHLVYEFYWHEFCDWYVELTKPRLYGGADHASSETARQVLYHVLSVSLHLLHPFMPFITEEIWSLIGGEQAGQRLIVSPWPTINPGLTFEEDRADMELFKELIYRIRNIRGEMNIAPDKKASIILKTTDERLATLIKREEVQLKNLARIEKVTVDPEYTPARTDSSALVGTSEIFIPLKDLIDVDVERARLQKEQGRFAADLARVEGKLANQGFVAKAPAEVIEKEKEKCAELKQALEKIEQSLAKLEDL